ncbi:conserved hypothetical protein [Oenococcus oeni]|uniref:hypothetical protein n=1 Tax=Oenococcus oeni TaxID=1247 RepID=UPI0010B7DF55|nr:hypothetical protein [Oenococcus oeni]SYW12250.1 conserved hypothetical protein [Oenococcus oeni]
MVNLTKKIIQLSKNQVKKNIYNSFKKDVNFDNRSKNSDNVVMVLAGYKSYFWDDFFARIFKFVPDSYDVVVISSGKVSDPLSKICKAHNWSYISSAKNNVSLLQNIAVDLFPLAKYIYKIDEDIFITKHFFSGLKKTMDYAEAKGKYKVSFVAPLTNVNGYSYSILLDYFHARSIYEKEFGRAFIESGPRNKIETNSEIAKFMWGKGGYLPMIDEMDDTLGDLPFSFSICPIRFSIGAILYPRYVWEQIGGFPVNFGNGMGVDEEKINGISINYSISRVPYISENTVVGHGGFGSQARALKNFFESHPEITKLKS